MGGVAADVRIQSLDGPLSIPQGSSHWTIGAGPQKGESVSWAIVSKAIDRELTKIRNGEESSWLNKSMQDEVKLMRENHKITAWEMGNFDKLANAEGVIHALELSIGAIAAEVNGEQ